MKTLRLFLLILVLSSCEKNTLQDTTKEYFDLKNLITNQIDILSKGDYGLIKNAELNNEKEYREFIPDSLGWSDELKLFYQADINSPSLSGVYEMMEGPGEISSNLREIGYFPANEISTGVQFIKIFYVEDINDPRKIELQLSEVNSLYRSKTNLLIQFRRDGNNQLVVEAYEIEGHQKMTLMDSIFYRLSGEVISP